MTWFCVSKIFGPVGPEKMVICDRSAFAERSCRGGHWPSEKLRFAETTGYVHAGRFRMTNGHPYGEDMALHRRGRCPHRPGGILQSARASSPTYLFQHTSKHNTLRTQRKKPGTYVSGLCWRRPIFPCSLPQSIVGADELNYCVRNGNRWTLVAKNTNYLC